MTLGEQLDMYTAVRDYNHMRSAAFGVVVNTTIVMAAAKRIITALLVQSTSSVPDGWDVWQGHETSYCPLCFLESPEPNSCHLI